jgi:hypothetical protein
MTSRMRMRLAKLATLLGGVSLLWACNAPPIVVPPPYTPDVVFTSQLLTDASGQQTTVWTGAQPMRDNDAAGATFFIYDLNLNAGAIQTADDNGMFTTTPAWAGAMNDKMSIYFLTPLGTYSESICLLLTEGSSAVCPPP